MGAVSVPRTKTLAWKSIVMASATCGMRSSTRDWKTSMAPRPRASANQGPTARGRAGSGAKNFFESARVAWEHLPRSSLARERAQGRRMPRSPRLEAVAAYSKAPGENWSFPAFG
jgi:hypothetical protein